MRLHSTSLVARVNHVSRRSIRAAKACPGVHQLAPLVEQIATSIRGLDLGRYLMRESFFNHMVWKRSSLRCPVTEMSGSRELSDLDAYLEGALA